MVSQVPGGHGHKPAPHHTDDGLDSRDDDAPRELHEGPREVCSSRGDRRMSQGHTALDPVWHYWGWDTKEKKPIKLDQQPLQTTAIQAQLQVLEKAVPLDGVLTGFKSTKDLELDLEGEVVPMMGAVGHRAMTLLSGNAVCKLVGMRMRPERLAGQPAAKQLEENFIQATVHGAGGGSSAG